MRFIQRRARPSGEGLGEGQRKESAEQLATDPLKEGWKLEQDNGQD
jgi:hypothetical protein